VTQSNSSKNKKSSDIPINRGVDLILNGVKKPKQLFNLNLNQRFKFFKREISIKLNFSFDIKKEIGEEPC
jgi:hypothetical protein